MGKSKNRIVEIKPDVEYWKVGYILEKIYNSEIHLRIGWMWDGGIDYSIGSESNDMWDSEFNKSEIFYTGEPDLTKAILTIADHVAREYPDSIFRKWYSDFIK